MTTDRHNGSIRGKSGISSHLNPDEEAEETFDPAGEPDVQQEGNHGPRPSRDRRRARASCVDSLG